MGNGLAIAALVVSIVSLFLFIIPVFDVIISLVGIILAIIALRKGQSKVMSIIGLVVGIIALLIGIAWTALFIVSASIGMDMVEQLESQNIDCQTSENINCVASFYIQDLLTIAIADSQGRFVQDADIVSVEGDCTGEAALAEDGAIGVGLKCPPTGSATATITYSVAEGQEEATISVTFADLQSIDSPLFR